MMGIYKIENLINGKIYIGQSINIKERWQTHKQLIVKQHLTKDDLRTLTYPLYQALKKYGLENFDFSVIEECSLDQLDEREKYWIQFYHSYIGDPLSHGYNLTVGGQGFLKTTEEQVQQIVKLWEEGKSTGEIVEQVKCQKHAVLSYLKSLSNYTIEESIRRGQAFNGSRHTKRINRYDHYGNFIKQYNSILAAAEDLQITSAQMHNILNCSNVYNDDYYIYANRNQKEELIRVIQRFFKNNKPVLQYDMNDNFIARFKSASAAARAINQKHGSNISSCCHGITKSAYGFKWQYEQPPILGGEVHQ